MLVNLKYVLDLAEKGNFAIDTFMKSPIEAVKDFCISRIKLVGADNKA